MSVLWKSARGSLGKVGGDSNTLGDGSSTLGDGTGVVGVLGVVFVKNSASLLMALLTGVPVSRKGAGGDGGCLSS